MRTLSLILALVVVNATARAEEAKGFVEKFFDSKENYSMILKADKAVVYRIHFPKDPKVPTRPNLGKVGKVYEYTCLLYTSPSPRDLSTSRMPSSA